MNEAWSKVYHVHEQYLKHEGMFVHGTERINEVILVVKDVSRPATIV